MSDVQRIAENIDAAVGAGVKKAKAHAVKNVVNIRVVAEPTSSYILWGCRSMEEKRLALESWASELEAFVRDHRSRDGVSLTVEKETEAQCSVCGGQWEVAPPDKYSDEYSCACCGAILDEPEGGSGG